ncbi:MAG: hypothetical protein HC902_08300 [Calothrix sp. SM1_5_4]|nr:hypothetical protein [Calothrix sp. SM1_5_4]
MPLKSEKMDDLKNISILSYQVPQIGLIRPWLDSVFKRLGISITSNVVEQGKFLEMDWDKSENDLVLFSFGVADPEPTTWLSLVLGSKFVSFDVEDRGEFDRLMGISDFQTQVQGYRDLLIRIARKGGYARPLLHGATISIGSPGMSFDLVDPLDETVDYSKIRFSH